jgi:hypothetical protein
VYQGYAAMINEDIQNQIINKYMLAFLDDYVEAYGVLPSQDTLRIWQSGFIDGCNSIGEALRMDENNG